MITVNLTCAVCGQAEYSEIVAITQPIGSSVLGIGSVGAANAWRVVRCQKCGHVQLFLVEP